MQLKPQPIPIKWYLASLVGALCLALVLMTTFEILGRGNPKVASKLNRLSLDNDHVVLSAGTEEESPAPKKPEARKEPQPDLKSPPETPHSTPPSQAPDIPPKNQLSAPQPQPQPPKDSPLPEPSLWSLLVSSAVVFGAVAIVLIGSVLLARNAILARRQRTG